MSGAIRAELLTGPTGSRRIYADATSRGGERSRVDWHIAEEVPVALMLNSKPYTVLMATPTDLVDFGRGFVLAEGLAFADEIDGVLILPADTGSSLSRGMAVDVAIDESVFAARARPTRSMEGRTGCGLCGLAEIADVVRAPHSVAGRPARSLDAPAVLRAADALGQLQPMNLLNRSVHAAAFADETGAILLVREDVGRHNALDKLIGALARADIDVSSGFVLMTSRCSFELVQKAATVGLGALVTISAPTALALDVANAAGLHLAALGAGGVVYF